VERCLASSFVRLSRTMDDKYETEGNWLINALSFFNALY